MATVQIVDIEQIVGDYLRDHPDIIDLDARVAGQLPRSFTKPWVRVTLHDAIDIRRGAFGAPEHCISYLIQFDCYAGAEEQHGQAEASLLARSVRAALKNAPTETLLEAVITSATITTYARIPDNAFEPPRERYILVADIHAHARPDQP